MVLKMYTSSKLMGASSMTEQVGRIVEGGKYLRKRREDAHLSLNQAENGTGIKSASISQIELAQIKNPSAGMLVKYAEFLGIGPVEILRVYGYTKEELPQDEVKVDELRFMLSRLPENKRLPLIESFIRQTRTELE